MFFDFDKLKKQAPRDYGDYLDDEYDYEFSDEFIFEDEYGDIDRYDIYTKKPLRGFLIFCTLDLWVLLLYTI